MGGYRQAMAPVLPWCLLALHRGGDAVKSVERYFSEKNSNMNSVISSSDIASNPWRKSPRRRSGRLWPVCCVLPRLNTPSIRRFARPCIRAESAPNGSVRLSPRAARVVAIAFAAPLVSGDSAGAAPPPPEPERESFFRSYECAYLQESDRAYTDSKLEALAERVDLSLEAVSTYRLLRLREINGRADRLLDYMERQNTKSFFVRLAVAEREALAGRWVGDDLEAAAAGAGPGASDHLLHVRAVAYLRAGRLDDVIECLAGRANRGECRLDGLLALAEALRAERAGEPMSPDAMERPSLATLVRAIFAADRACARGEHNEVLGILDQAWIREVCEAQSMARLADVYLATGTADPPTTRLRASTLLAYFVDAQFSGTRNRQLWLGESTWSAERLAKLTEDAQLWMAKFSWKPDAS